MTFKMIIGDLSDEVWIIRMASKLYTYMIVAAGLVFNLRAGSAQVSSAAPETLLRTSKNDGTGAPQYEDPQSTVNLLTPYTPGLKRLRLRPGDTIECLGGVQIFGDVHSGSHPQAKQDAPVYRVMDEARVEIESWGRRYGWVDYSRVKINGEHIRSEKNDLVFYVNERFQLHCLGHIRIPERLGR